MSASKRAKDLGAKSLIEISEFYGNTTQTMRNLYKRKPLAFDAMVIGFLKVRKENAK